MQSGHLTDTDKNGMSALHLAAMSTDPTLLPSLLNDVADKSEVPALLTSNSKRVKSPLYYACKMHRTKQIIYILNQLPIIPVEFFAYLHKHASLLAHEDLDKKTKEKLIEQHRKMVIFNQDDIEIKKRHLAFAGIISLQCAARENLLLNFDVTVEDKQTSKSTDLTLAKALGLNNDMLKKIKQQEQTAAQIAKDKQQIDACSDKIAGLLGELKIRKSKNTFKLALKPTAYTFKSTYADALELIGNVSSRLLALFVILSYALYIYPSALITLNGTLILAAISNPIGISILTLTAVLIIGGAIMYGVGAYLNYKKTEALRKEAALLLPEIEELYAKLINVQKNAPEILLLNGIELSNFISDFSNDVYCLREADKHSYKEIKDALVRIHKTLECTSHTMLANKQPISPVADEETKSEIRNEKTVSNSSRAKLTKDIQANGEIIPLMDDEGSENDARFNFASGR